MKALSIQQPYAWAIAAGFKPVENRTWKTGFRGPCLIHAGQKVLKDDIDSVIAQIADQTGTPRHMVRNAYDLQAKTGGLVGFGTITDCVSEHPSEWFHGPYGFVFDDVRKLNFIACKGRLGFFDVPDDVAAALINSTNADF